MKIASWIIRLVFFFRLASAFSLAGDMAVHSSKRYYQDAFGKPLFLLGYYDWSAVPDHYYIDHPSRYSRMMLQEQPFHLNYIRISLGVNRMSAEGHPPSWDGTPTPVPFLYVNTGGIYKADLDQWDPIFWEGLKAQCALAKRSGFVVHVSIFDGVELRRQGGADYGYANSFWNHRCQIHPFYSNPDKNQDGQIDEGGEFYDAAEFNGAPRPHTLSYYQKKLIDKLALEISDCDNVFIEIGNELLGSDTSWNTAAVRYIKSRTGKPVSQCNNNGEENRGNGLQGWSQHNANTPAEVKANVAAIVGRGWPAWEDPDGPALSDPQVSSDDLRRAAWYAFVGGAACWGGFTVDLWAAQGRDFNTNTANFYANVQRFIQDSQVPFWNMTPQHNLVSNPTVNSCLARKGKSYVAYVWKDATAKLDLSGVTGSAYCKLYDPTTGTWSALQTITNGTTKTFTKPLLANDWVIYVHTEVQEPSSATKTSKLNN